MSSLGLVAKAFSLWIETVARTVSAPLEKLKSVRRIEVVEDDAGIFTMQLPAKPGKGGDMPPCRIAAAEGQICRSLSPEWAAMIRGGRIEVLLRPSRFVFRQLDLPSRAVEFLNGIIRAQIDRLTPWTASEAVYHWTPPRGVAGDRIELTIVATGRAAVVSLAQEFSDCGAAIVEVSTAPFGAERVMVHNQRAGGRTGFGRLRLALVAGLATAAVLAVLSRGVAGLLCDSYDTQQQQIQRRIAERRAILRGSQIGSATTPIELLARRKLTTPSSVMAIEALSALLPDDTYATDVRIEGNKLQLVGITRNAPSLIQILEQSPHFSSAVFFAPTTRAANEPGERFHIEARLKAHFGFGS
ncbi:PilN domain-containing protein [Rhodopseudomonas palustris]|uniref:Fimbrial assembly n=1 Tax=Rhodopseudomonas palustris (strain BisB18) TaxID=316056 RepID=Q212Y9_RHOPB